MFADRSYHAFAAGVNFSAYDEPHENDCRLLFRRSISCDLFIIDFLVLSGWIGRCRHRLDMGGTPLRYDSTMSGIGSQEENLL